METTAPQPAFEPLPVALSDIEAAHALLHNIVIRTPTVTASTLADHLGLDLHLKLENQQVTGSFKARGAYVKLSRLSAEERRHGVIAMSAGNHAQGVAYHAGRMGIPATIVMSETTPNTKVERTRALGASVVRYGRTIAEAALEVERLMEAQGPILVHPYDDPAIVAGQGTIGIEMMEDTPDIETIIVPIGGGGLISGIAVAAKTRRPDIRIVGVEAAMYPSMYEALAGLPPSSGGETIAEGIAVKRPGEINKAIVRELVDEIVLVSETELERAVHMLAESQKTIAEGAGAAGIAALLSNPTAWAGQRIGVVICGGNIDSRLLSSVLMRGLIRDGRLARVRIQITDEPGVLARISGVVGDAGGNIVEVYHQRLFQDVLVKHAEVDIVMETRNADHLDQIVSSLSSNGFRSRVLSTLGQRDEPL